VPISSRYTGTSCVIAAATLKGAGGRSRIAGLRACSGDETRPCRRKEYGRQRFHCLIPFDLHHRHLLFFELFQAV